MRRLLVIDDEPAMARFVKRVAEQAGFAVRTETRPEPFKAAVAEFDPDVIVLDLAMPDMDGIELMRDLSEQGCQAQLLIMSGFDQSMIGAAQKLAVARGLAVAGSLSKPFGAAELRAALASIRS